MFPFDQVLCNKGVTPFDPSCIHDVLRLYLNNPIISNWGGGVAGLENLQPVCQQMVSTKKREIQDVYVPCQGAAIYKLQYPISQ